MDIVSEVQRRLAERLGSDLYTLWFESATQILVEGNTLTIAMANSFRLDHVRQRYRDDLVAVSRSLLGDLASLRFWHDPALAPAGDEVGETEPTSGRGHGSGGPRCGHSRDGESASAAGQGEESTIDSHSGRRPAGRGYWSLDNFVQCPASRMAYLAALDVVRRPGATTPLFLYGPTGCGKTHLLEGICSEMRQRGASRRCVLLSAEQFTSCFLEALQGHGLPSFRRKHRAVDALVIDDIQFFAGKRATLIELHHTIDDLLRGGRQVVLAADRSPSELSGITAELSARMVAGLVCPIGPPDHACRTELVRRFMTQCNLPLLDEVVDLIASEIVDDPRLLRGAVNLLRATYLSTGEAITLPIARAALGDVFRGNRRAIQIWDVDRAVCDVFGLESKTLRSNSKCKAVCEPRALAMWLARKYTRAAYSEIGDYFGRRSHSTVISAQKKVNLWVSDGATIRLTNGDCRIEDAIRRVETQLRTG